jgi:hypothetical protein
MSNQEVPLNDNDVISTSESALMFQNTFKVGEYLNIVQTKLEAEPLFGEGLTCQLLRPGLSWTNGKVKIRLEFVPDEGETTDFNTPTDGEKGTPSTNFGPPITVPGVQEDRPQNVGMWS